MIKESFLMVDAFAQKDNIFTRIDARLKVFFSVIILALIIGLPWLALPVAVFAGVLVAMYSIKIPVKLIFGRIIAPMVLGLIVLIFMMFSQGHDRLELLQLGGFQLIIYLDGLMAGLAIMARISSSVILLFFLSITTPVHELGYALIWFRLPKVLVEIFLLTYRYLFVLWDEGMRIKQAQSLRLGYPDWHDLSGWKRAIKSTITLMGMVFVRAYDRAESTFYAMEVRGYNGNIAGNGYRGRIKIRDLASGIVAFIIIAVVIN